MLATATERPTLIEGSNHLSSESIPLRPELLSRAENSADVEGPGDLRRAF